MNGSVFTKKLHYWKNLLIILFIAIVIASVWWVQTIKITKEETLIRETVLNELEAELEFCEIIKDDIDKGGFWLICNGRPFYATYDGDMNYEMNGWSWLKDDLSLWSDLNDCDFYDSEKVDDLNYNLIFYCPKDLNLQEITAKQYNYNLETLKMEKFEEKDFLEMITEKIRNKYEFLKECSVKTEVNIERSEKPIILTFDCDGEKIITSVLLHYQYSSLPFFEKKGLSQEEKIRFSFEKVLGEKCEIEGIESDIVYAKCDDFRVTVRYNFEPFYLSEYKFRTEKLSEEIGTLFLNNYGKYLTLARIENPVFLNQYKKPLLVNDFLRYQVDGDCITLVTSGNSIEGLIKESEKIWE